jgi:hypothetical protein
MNHSQEKVLRYLTGSDNVDSIAVEDLQKLAEENPYFTVAQFLLTKKLKDQNNQSFLPQVQKTALYFSNPYWLHYQLEEPTTDSTIQDNIPYSQEKIEINSATTNSLEGLHPITTEFSIGEIEAASTLAHDTLEEALGEDLTSNKQEQLPTSEIINNDIHPITTEFSVGELEAASELANETLRETDNEEIDRPVWVEASENTSIPHTQEQENLLEQTKINTLDEENATALDEAKEEINQPEEEMAAITRDTDEKTDEFLKQLPKTEQSIFRDNIEEVVLETISPVGSEDRLHQHSIVYKVRSPTA